MAALCLVLAAPTAHAQVVVTPVVTPVVTSTVTPVVTSTVNAVVTPVVTSTVNAMVTPTVNASVNAHVNAVVNPVVNAYVHPVVNPVVNVNPIVDPVIVPPVVMPNIDVNPDVNVDVDVNITGIDMNEGKWFATIKGDKIEFEFRGTSDDDENHWSSNETFNLSDFPNLPKGQKGEFSLKREAGTMTFNGKFEDDMGFGTYKFSPDQAFGDFIKNSGVTDIHQNDPFAWFD
jgi:hypothetical protein